MRLNGALLKDARDRKGLTQQELADALDMSVPTIGRAESGEDIWPTTGREICKFLGIDLAVVVLARKTGTNGDGDVE